MTITSPTGIATTEYLPHPAADLFPMMAGPELEELAADIAANGLREAISTWSDGQTAYLLDGRNRKAACNIAGVAPIFQAYAGDDPISFVISKNVHRRHLTPGQKAFVALELEPMYAEQASKRMLAGKKSDPVTDPSQGAEKSRDKAAAVVGASGSGVSRAKRLQKEDPELAEQVKSGDIAIDKADRIIRDRLAPKREEPAPAPKPLPVPPDEQAPDTRPNGGWCDPSDNFPTALRILRNNLEAVTTGTTPEQDKKIRVLLSKTIADIDARGRNSQ